MPAAVIPYVPDGSWRKAALSGSEIVGQVTQSTQIPGQAVAEANRTNVTVQGLSAAAQEIGDVVELISDIASESNFLALNATIEAARGGEAGRALVASHCNHVQRRRLVSIGRSGRI
jgi:methyl-accepting chemotaxis protein